MHPRLPLTKHFFFPGFTARTGGLLAEAALDAQRRQFQSDPSSARDFLAALGVTASEMAATTVSLFCYPGAPVAALFGDWEAAGTPLTCLVPEGVATEAVEAFLGSPASAGAVATCGALTVRVLPFVAQPDYDKLLWACDVNFVRGEDSFVRAQWAGKPFIWHIYAQDENLHHVKLRAFLQRYAGNLGSLTQLSLAWNGAIAPGAGELAWSALWQQFDADLPRIAQRAEHWRDEMAALGDLANNMLRFARSLRSATQ